MKVGTSLKDVDASARCRKPRCSTRSFKLCRHHKRHEFMFVSAFVRRRTRETEYRKFVEEYYSFLPSKTVRICESHHAEIHLIYDDIIRNDLKRTKKALREYSWAQADKLMRKLERACNIWMGKETPGEDPSILKGVRRKTKGGFTKAVAAMRKHKIHCDYCGGNHMESECAKNNHLITRGN